MSKFISSNELWDRICEKLNYPNTPKGLNKTFIEDENGIFSLNHYNTGLGIRYSLFTSKYFQDTVVENTNAYNSSFFTFNTGKGMYMEDARKNKKVRLDPNICWNGDMYEGHYSNCAYEKDQQAILHNITFDKQLFKELSKNSEKFANTKSVYKGDYIDVNFNNHLNTKQKLLLDDLSKISMLDDRLHMLYLESKLLDLVYTTFESIEQQNESTDIYLSTKDIECLNKAKALLIENMINPPSLKELAYKSAINEFKLKKGFKQLFGNTVYGLLQEYRLNEAKKLLESNEVNISEASMIVGYKSISHFSKIFKNHFGITPIQIKKESRSIYY